MEWLLDDIVRLLVPYVSKVLGAVVTLLVGWILIGKLSSGLRRTLRDREIDPSLKGYLGSFFGIGLKILLLLAVAQMFGVQTTSFVALFSAMAFAVGLALQGNLTHFAAGVLVLLIRPFRVGHRITTQGQTGEVVEVQLFHTILKNDEGKKIIIPNGPIMSGVIINHSDEPKRLE
jgi:small conductance mechanosensitive channel